MQRRIAAILVADMVGYSRLSELDEAGTLLRQKRHRQDLIDPEMERHNGTIIKSTGDGLIAEFASVVEAMQCAVTIQRAIDRREQTTQQDRRIAYRVAVHLGDVVFDDGDIYGDGVNVAARLEALAEPGGIIVSGTAHDMLKNHVDVGYRSLGEKQLKNIAEPVRVYQADMSAGGRPPPARRKLPFTVIAGMAACLVLAMGGALYWSGQFGPVAEPVAGPGADLIQADYQPMQTASIVVLPFSNLSDSSEQAYFAQGVTEDVTTGLSRFRELFVISSATAASYRASNRPVRDVGRELSVRYVLKGSVRRAGDTVRVTAELVDAVQDRNVWSDKIDRGGMDVFALQDELTRKIIGAILPEMEADAISRTHRSENMSITTWEKVARANWHAKKYTPTDSARAETLFLEATDRDPGSATAHAYLANLYSLDAIFAWHRPQPQSLKLAFARAQKAVQLDPRNALAHTAMAMVLYNLRRHQDAVRSGLKAVAANPNLAIAHGMLGIVYTYTHEFEKARASLDQALSLSPRDPFRPVYLAHYGMIAFNAGKYDEGTPWFLKAVEENPNWPSPRRGLAANYGMAGNIEKAREAYAGLKTVLPGVTLSQTRKAVAFAFPDDADRFIQGLRRAGMPE